MTNESDDIHYALVFYPSVDRGPIDAIRRKYDPTVDFIAPHVTVLFPVPARIGEEKLFAHIESVLKRYSPFEIRFGGLEKSPDHWLLLTLEDGVSTVKALYGSLYSGILAEFRRADIDFVPHLGLGLFLDDDATYDPWHPQESDFAHATYEVALQEAKGLSFGPTLVESLHMVKIPGDVMEWVDGRGASFPRHARVEEVHQFRLPGSGPR